MEDGLDSRTGALGRCVFLMMRRNGEVKEVSRSSRVLVSRLPPCNDLFYVR